MGYEPHDEADSRLKSYTEAEISELEKEYTKLIEQIEKDEKTKRWADEELYEEVVDILMQVQKLYQKLDDYVIDYDEEKYKKVKELTNKYIDHKMMLELERDEPQYYDYGDEER